MTEGCEYAAERRLRALRPCLVSMGSRTVCVAGGAVPRDGVLAVVGPTRASVDVVATPLSLPLASGCLTGLSLAAPLDGRLEPVLAEALRVVTPGGCVLVTGTLDGAWEAVEAVAEAAGGDVVARLPIGPLPAQTRLPRALWWWAAWWDRRRVMHGARGAVEAGVVVRRRGGAEVRLPEAREVLSTMFVPLAWSRRRSARRG